MRVRYWELKIVKMRAMARKRWTAKVCVTTKVTTGVMYDLSALSSITTIQGTLSIQVCVYLIS